MRPRFLELEGLQSFREMQRIDFDRLGENGLFGIFGPTGSGKSTLLDAMTLALYGNVLRAARGTQGIINVSAGTVRVAFTFDLQKEGARKTYRVERMYRRKKDSDQSAEIKVARLLEVLEDGESILADRPAEVTDKVETLIGLTLDDFTRSVVLPQNRFHEFLLMEKSKKRDMLERIFYLEEYGRQLSEKVSRQLLGVRYKLSEIQGALSQLGDASEKALVEARGRMQTARGRREKADNELKLLEARFQEAREVWELSGELALLLEKEKKHRLDQEAHRNMKKLLEDARKAESVAPAIKRHEELHRELSETELALAEVNESFPEMEEHLNAIKADVLKHRSYSEQEKPRLIEQKTRLSEALVLQEEVAGLGTELNRLRDHYQSLRAKAAEKEKELRKSEAELEEAQNRQKEARALTEELKTDAERRNELRTAAKAEEELERILTDIRKQEAALNQLHKTREACEKQRGVLAKRKAGVLEQLKQAEADLNALNARMEEKLAARDHLEAFKKQIEWKLQEAERQRQSNLAAELAEGLEEGVPCPVCGSTHHPQPAVYSGQEVGGGSHRDADGQETGTVGQENGTEKSLQVLKEQLDRTEKSLRAAELEAITLRERIHGLTAAGDRIAAQLGAEPFKTGQKAHSGLIRDSSTGTVPEQVQALLESLHRETAALVSEETRIEAELQLLQGNTNQAEAAFKEIQGGYDRSKETLDEQLKRLGFLSAREELKKVDENDRKLEALQKQEEALHRQVMELREKRELLMADRNLLLPELGSSETEGRNRKKLLEEKQGRLNTLTGGKDAVEVIRATEEALKVIGESEKQLADRQKGLEEAFQALALKRSGLHSRLDLLSRDLREEEEKLRKTLLEKGFGNVDDIRRALLNFEQQKLLEEEILQYEKISGNLEAQRNIYEMKLDGRSITEEEWLRINREQEAKKQEKEEAISAFEGEKNAYAVIKNNVDAWMKLNSEWQQLSRKQELLEQIQKLLKGNSFIEYIAEERLRYIAREASETLGVLTKYKYVLELDSENGFVIRDQANGGVYRPVSSLSGGETFLTSLSLALALSKQIQLKGQSPLEFFFLDEGFGTLDSQLLDTVIDALGRISSKERVIGLISHVPELRSRMTRRLVVEPPDVEGSGSRVRLERA